MPSDPLGVAGRFRESPNALSGVSWRYPNIQENIKVIVLEIIQAMSPTSRTRTRHVVCYDHDRF